MTALHTVIRTVEIGILLASATTAVLQPLTCAELAAQALATANENCLNLEANQACYGHPQVSATLTDSSLTFESPGDRVPFDKVSSLTTAPYDAETDTWGIAYVRGIDAAGVEFELMLFGSVTLVNDSGGLQLEIVDENACANAPSGVMASSADESETATIIINGETVTLSETPLAVTFRDGALETPASMRRQAATPLAVVKPTI